MSNYIGLDAHTSTCTFVTLDSQGNLITKARVPTTERHLLQFVRGLKGKKRLVFEETNLSKWLHALFAGEVDEQTVCNVYYLGKRPGAKDDDKDAWHLANELRCGHIVPVFHEQNDLMDMRALTSSYLDVVSEIVRAKNRYKSLFQSEAIPTTGSAIYRDKDKIKELKKESNRFVAEGIFSQISHLEGIKKKYLERFKKNKKHPAIRRLDSVPGFDVVRSHIVAALICSPHRFKNKHKFWAYSMLVRHNQISDGKSYGQKKIYGRSELKAVFQGAALATLKGNSSLRKYYDRLRSKGADHRTARKAVARKIAAICLYILKKETVYDDNFEEKKKKEAAV